MDLDVSDADWVPQATSYILLWFSLILARSLVSWKTLISETCIDSFVLYVMVVIYAHVPMSLRARTSVPDLWSENKGNEKEWIWVDEHADWDSWMASYIGLWFVGCLARQSSLCNSSGFRAVAFMGRWYPVCVLCALLSTTSVDQWDTPWRPLRYMQ